MKQIAVLPALDLNRDRHLLSEMRRTLDRALGRREATLARVEQITREVGLAKGRLELKPKVDAFLADLQAEANNRAVGAYSRLLTGLVGDVLGPHAGSIELDLYTSQGLPALDLYLRTAKGKRVSVLNHTAGSVVNLVSLGLRATSTVRSGKRKFIALDEPDCWTRPSRVPAFYSVIGQLAENLDIQFLVVSHNDASLLPEGTAIVKLRLGSDGTILAEGDPDAREWEEGQEGIRYIRLKDFRNHKETIVPLSPGVTAIVGDNSIGKSAVLHALRCICYGDVVDGDIRDDAEEQRLEIELGIEGGRSIVLTRQPKRNPVNEWTMYDEAGELVYDSESGHPLKKGGRLPPEFASHFLGIERMEDLDVQLSHQLFPVFLLGEPPSKRAKVLSIGREAGHIGAMIALQKARCQEDAQTVRNGEKELAVLYERLESLKGIDEVAEALDGCEALLQQVTSSTNSLSLMSSLLARYGRAWERNERANRQLAAFEHLPDEELLGDLGGRLERNALKGHLLQRWERASLRHRQARNTLEAYAHLPDHLPELVNVEEVRRLGSRYSFLERQVATQQKRLAALSTLPEAPPELRDVQTLAGYLARYERAQARKAEMEQREVELDRERLQIEQELEKTLAAMGNRCPTCGSHVSASTIVEHAGPAAH